MTIKLASQSLRLAAAITFTAFAVLLAGCGSQTGPTSSAPQAGTGSVSEFAALFGSYAADYEPERTPAALADKSLLVVEGRIARIDKGRTFGTSASDPAASSSIVMALNVQRVLHGTMPAGAGGTVYVELPAPRAKQAAVFDRAAPKSSDVVLYLIAAATKADTPLVNPDAGRPAGQSLFQPTNPQGFVIDAGGTVVQVLEISEIKGASLAQFLPGAASFPGHETSVHNG
jgi:hypothetical protein